MAVTIEETPNRLAAIRSVANALVTPVMMVATPINWTTGTASAKSGPEIPWNKHWGGNRQQEAREAVAAHQATEDQPSLIGVLALVGRCDPRHHRLLDGHEDPMDGAGQAVGRTEQSDLSIARELAQQDGPNC